MPDQLIHHRRAGLYDWANLMPVDKFSDRGSTMAGEKGNLLDRDARVKRQRDEGMPQLARSPLGGVEPGRQSESATRFGTSVNSTTLRFTLSRAIARFTERLSSPRTPCRVRVLSESASTASQAVTSGAVRSRSRRAPSSGRTCLSARYRFAT